MLNYLQISLHALKSNDFFTIFYQFFLVGSPCDMIVVFTLIQLVLSEALQAVQLIWLWKCMETTQSMRICLQGLIFVATTYRSSLDKKGSLLLMLLIVLNTVVTFRFKSFYVKVFLMTMNAILLKTFSEFHRCMLNKIYIDLIISSIRSIETCSFDKILSEAKSSTITDLLFFATHFGAHIWLSITSASRTSIEDLFLIPVCMSHVLALYFKHFTQAYLGFILALTLLWICKKSQRFDRIQNVFIRGLD